MEERLCFAGFDIATQTGPVQCVKDYDTFFEKTFFAERNYDIMSAPGDWQAEGADRAEVQQILGTLRNWQAESAGRAKEFDSVMSAPGDWQAEGADRTVV